MDKTDFGRLWDSNQRVYILRMLSLQLRRTDEGIVVNHRAVKNFSNVLVGTFGKCLHLGLKVQK